MMRFLLASSLGLFVFASCALADLEIRSPLAEAKAIQTQLTAVADHAAGSVFAVTAFSQPPLNGELFAATLSGLQFGSLVEKLERSCGSAFAVDDEGRLLTNEHVVSGTSSVWVTDDKGQTFPALVLGTDPRSDLAVLQIPCRTKQLSLAHDRPTRGDLVLTLGNPDGISTDGGICASVGNVSVSDRSLPRLSEREKRNYSHMIQVTTPIAVGSSGGPLLDIEGHVLGVVCAVATPSQDTSVPIGFATNLTSADMRERIRRLARGEEIVYGYLGVMVSPEIDPSRPAGVRVDRVDIDTPAHGILKEGDIVLRFDGTPVGTDKNFIELAGTSPIDRDVELRVRRGETELDLMVRPRRRVLPAASVTLSSQRLNWAGVVFRNHESGGVIVDVVAAGVDGGPKPGTVVRHVNGETVSNLSDLLHALHRHAGKTLTLDDAAPTQTSD